MTLTLDIELPADLDRFRLPAGGCQFSVAVSSGPSRRGPTVETRGASRGRRISGPGRISLAVTTACRATYKVETGHSRLFFWKWNKDGRHFGRIISVEWV